MSDTAWQDDALAQLQRLLEPDPDIVALVLFGSLADSPEHRDDWSDVDLIVVTRAGATGRFFPSPDWLLPLGGIWAYEAIAKPNTRVLLTSLDAYRRIDAVIFEDTPADTIATWPDNPFRGARRTIFSRSGAVDDAVRSLHGVPSPPPAPLSSHPTNDSFRSFWLGAESGVRKVVRGDLLIASHLALDLVRRCLEREMQLRDIAAGTRHHPHGQPSDAAALERAQAMLHALSTDGVLDTIADAAARYDELCAALDSSHTPHAAPLLAAIRRARGRK